MTFSHPFQKLCYVQSEGNNDSILLAASGPVICSISTKDGQIMSRWPSQNDEELSDDESARAENENNDGPPAKRRKVDLKQQNSLSRQASDASEDSIEIVAERKKGERRRPKVLDSKLSNVSHLLATKDGLHVVAVTADDKSVKVFQLKQSGRLQLISERSLPKRLCALQLTADERTILAADKFGDVYAMPLHPSNDYAPKSTMKQAEPTYSPSATELTVHTKGNREALRQQLVQKKFKPRKEGPEFEHQLLLGHVSLLTDLLVAEAEVAGRSRSYILTADRDEHIRVSRGIPQAHIIESYCLGHQEFISRLCVPLWAPDILIAGNGEPSLRTFHWKTGRPIQEVNLLQCLLDDIKINLENSGRSTEKVVVSGIWSMGQFAYPDKRSRRNILVVALEGMPILLTYKLDSQRRLQHLHTLHTHANVLDLVQTAEDQIVISIDHIHKQYSVKTFREADDEVIDPLSAYRLVEGHSEHPANGCADNANISWEEIALPATTQLLDNVPEVTSLSAVANPKNKGYEKIYSELGEFLYGLENLRKKRDMMVEEEAAEAAEPDNIAMPEIMVDE